jgi:hypothetical protein
MITLISVKYEKQDQQGRAAFNESTPHDSATRDHWQGAHQDPKQKQDRV